MAIAPYLAMTAAEIAENNRSYPHIAWLACHFAETGPGLADLPQNLPSGSLLTLNDQTLPDTHDTEAIRTALSAAVFRFGSKGLLLDFQRTFNEALFALSKILIQALPCPVAVSHLYAKEMDCPVFLPPLPLHMRLADHIAPWKGRDIWLDLSAEGERITVTAQGCTFTPLPLFTGPENSFKEENLHCHYSIALTDTAAEFTLWRTKEDFIDLLDEAETCGITAAVGLYQEIGKWF